MNEVLGRTRLGDCEGGSIGSATMEFYCFVVDFDFAIKGIKTKLK